MFSGVETGVKNAFEIGNLFGVGLYNIRYGPICVCQTS